MSIHKIDKILSYVNFLQGNPKEVEILFKELLIGVTNFFRDTAVWEKVKEIVLPGIFSGLQPGSILRAWVPGCSTGEEAYSLAIIFKEALEKIKPQQGYSLQIFATDIDAEAIEIARKGFFAANIAADVSADRLNRFFILSEDGYRVKTEIREMVIFAQHNIILHPPFTRIDILSCRNLLIYMDPELQKKLIGLFYYSINPEGIMMLGSSETLGTKSHLFTPVDAKLKIFKHSVAAHAPELFDFPSSFSRSKSTITEKPVRDRSGLNIQMLADQLLLQYYSPSGILVNENGDIIYIHGHTGKYLEPAVGKANLNVFAMLHEGLRSEFHSAFRRVVSKKETVVLRNLKIGTNGNTQTLNIDIKWIDKPELLYGTILIIFTDVREVADIHLRPEKNKKGFNATKQKELENELQRVREEMQNTLEEVQTSQEELRSTNEELQSTNEELQSTNEELTTSKEEMQSLNEELQTLNAELQAKVDDYSRVNNDMKNLLNSTEIATLFLDKELNIRRYTQQATKIFKLIKSDLGRPFTDISSELIYPDLANDAVEVLRTLVYVQKEVPTNDNRWLLIRIMPYRTFDDKIDGIVITFIDITSHKEIETRLAEAEEIKSILISTFANIEIELTEDWKILHMSPDAEEFFGISRKDYLKKNFINLFIPDTLRRRIEKNIKMHLGKAFHDKLKLKVKVLKGQTRVVECFVTSSLNLINNEKTIKISIIKKQNYE